MQGHGVGRLMRTSPTMDSTQGNAARLAVEALAQWRAEEHEPPTHLFLQGGSRLTFASRRGLRLHMAVRKLGECAPPRRITCGSRTPADCI